MQGHQKQGDKQTFDRDESWANECLRKLLSVVDHPEAVERIDINPPNQEARHALMLAVWNLAETDEDLARKVQPALPTFPDPYVRAGAMWGLRYIGDAESHLEAYRKAALDPHPEVRGGSARGLGISEERGDEELLWELLDDDDVSVQFAAAYALREMPRPIDTDPYLQAVRGHEVW